MHDTWTKLQRLARRVAFALFGGLMVAVVLPLIVATEIDPGTIWSYFHGALLPAALLLGSGFSYWLFDHLPRKPAPQGAGGDPAA
jgi:hypothetical protein